MKGDLLKLVRLGPLVILHTPAPLSHPTSFHTRGDSVELDVSDPLCWFFHDWRYIVPSKALGSGAGRGEKGVCLSAYFST
jgi:hypothetical protein